MFSPMCLDNYCQQQLVEGSQNSTCIPCKLKVCTGPHTQHNGYGAQDEKQIQSCENLHKLTLMDGDDITMLIRLFAVSM